MQWSVRVNVVIGESALIGSSCRNFVINLLNYTFWALIDVVAGFFNIRKLRLFPAVFRFLFFPGGRFSFIRLDSLSFFLEEAGNLQVIPAICEHTLQ
jgi:hypothetical protein